ncbi:hypothetical protein [Ramlibacter algicola]|uniref:Uncharacterized protein n=1 Tax=Ramlibacter algicola TaxID=2795217 RepID=A0A934Q121_9BURK|nr:hypothetical protein [Ramlibacter algicola]MBK0392793.1 hypothetical protein [Ramlibacter algicola]
MAFTVSPRGRQLAMAVMLGLAVAGAVLRWRAPNPSVWRDVGTLLLVMWLPAVGNLIGFIVRHIPRAAPPPTEFAPGSPFKAQAHLQLQAASLPAGFVDSLDAHDPRAVVLTGRHGFTVRMDRPVAQWLAAQGDGPVAVEYLLPGVALKAVKPPMPIRLLVGRTVVATGTVLPSQSAA